MHFDLTRIGSGLPVSSSVDELSEAVRTTGAVVVQAPPGTGKTTLVPPSVANLVRGRVVVTQPRRVAARAAARRLSLLANVRLGDEVGFVVRGESKVSSLTRVEFCTAGVLLRRLLNDPELSGIDAVVLDEVHERALETDLAFAMLAELRELRPELVLVVMSATLDAERWAGLLASPDPRARRGVPVVRVDADLHPLEVRWAPSSGLRTDARGVAPGFLDHLAEQASRLVDEAVGDVLVFAPGARECDRVVERLASRGVDAAALHGSLPPREQDRVLSARGRGGAALDSSGGGGLDSSGGNNAVPEPSCTVPEPVEGIGRHPRVIVATSVAESSLTVPGVRAVVDSGLSREPRYDSGRAMSGLVTVAEARSSAEQRAGRAARLGPGVVVRCFPQSDWAGMRPFTVPRILTGDLVQTALDLACWGSPGGVGLALPDAPPAAALADAHRVLEGLGAITVDGPGEATSVRVTPLGRRLAALPVEPRLGRALLACAAQFGAEPVAEVVAMLSGDDRAPGGDLEALLRELRGRRDPRWRHEVERLARLAAPSGPSTGSGTTSTGSRTTSTGSGIIAAVVASAFPDRIARRRAAGSREYLTTGGTGLELPRESSLGDVEWLAVAEMGRVGERAVVRSAVAIDEDVARGAAAAMLTEQAVGTWTKGRVTARRVVALGAIELSSTPVRSTPEAGARAVREALSRQGLGMLHWSEAATVLRRRLALLHRVMGDPWPAMDDASLVSRLDEWLAPEVDRLASGTPSDRLDLASALRRLLPWPAAGRLDELAPERIEVPTGSHVRLDYPEDPDGRVVLAVKLQECFGLLQTPTIADGRERVLMHLLSPAQRPLAVTDDLASFWTNAYPGVRAENRGRYIKHPWPEDPLTAPPRRGTTRSGK